MRKCSFVFMCILLTLQLFAQPVIHSFAPASGPVGTSVTIKGTGFSSIIGNNIVYFGAVKAAVSAATDTTLIVTAPIGATYSPITVTSNNLTAFSTIPFILTYPIGNDPFITTSFAPKSDFTTGSSLGNFPHSVSPADFNGDGKTDLLVSKGSATTISVLTNTSSGGNISFGANLEIAASGSNHEGSAVSDLDGDGKLDFVILNTFNSTSISVYRNTSTGSNISFAQKVDYAADNGPYCVGIGDLNNDGKPDIAVANNGSHVVSIYKNKSTPGTISFEDRVDITAGTYPFGIAVGDLDGDGKADLAVTCQGSSSATYVLRNTTENGNISFSSASYVASTPGPFQVTIADVDGDGKPDLATSSAFSNSIVVIRNNSSPGTLSFSSAQSFSTGSYPEGVAFHDLDGDGRLEMATVNNQGNNVSVLKNTSVPGNISFIGKVDYAVGSYPSSVAVSDLDGDGRPDIMAGNSSANNVSVLKNIMGLAVTPAISSFSPSSGMNGTIVKINGVNFKDVKSVQFGGVEAVSFTVESETKITATVGAGASGEVKVTTGYGVARLEGFQFKGPIIYSFSPVTAFAGNIVTIRGTNFPGVTDVKFGGTAASSFTIDSAGMITATVGNGASGEVSVTSANGTSTLTGFSFGGTFVAPPAISSISPASGPVGTLVTIIGKNFDPAPSGNTVFFGAVKAVVTAATSTQLTVVVPAGTTYKPVTVTTNNLTAYSSQLFRVTFPVGNKTLTESSFVVSGNYPASIGPVHVVFSDIDGDGKPDLVTANSNVNTISVFKNTSTAGAISLDAKKDFGTGPGPRQVAIGDIDGDGKPDVVVSNLNSGREGSISILRNTSSGGIISFAPKLDYITGWAATGLRIGDLNADGKPDIAVATGNSYIFSIFQNITAAPGNISLAVRQDYPAPYRADDLDIADLNKDGLPEVITTNSINATVSIFRNISVNGNITLDSKIDYSTGTFPNSVHSGDFDGDGKNDLAVANYTAHTISVLKNYSTGSNIQFGGTQEYGAELFNIAIGDLNGDGKPDISGGSDVSGMAYFVENISGGTGSISFGTKVKISTGENRSYVAVGDLNGDSKPEIVVVHQNNYKLVILKNRTGEPIIRSITPSRTGTKEIVTISGENFSNVSAVNFGGVPAQAFTVVSPTTISATVGAGSSGAITVTTPSGTASLDGFQFIPGIVADGPTNFCNNGSVTLRSTAATNNQWYKDGVAIAGANASIYNATSSGTYTVKTASNSITTTSDTSVSVNMITVPTPVITTDANRNLISSATTGNQWYFNGSEIPGATSQMYDPSEAGSYTVRTTLNECKSELSVPFNLTLTGIIDLGNGQYINMYPNPVKDKVFLNWNVDGMTTLKVDVMNLEGKTLFSYGNLNNGAPIDVTQLQPGIYLIKVYNSQLKNSYTIRIIKGN